MAPKKPATKKAARGKKPPTKAAGVKKTAPKKAAASNNVTATAASTRPRRAGAAAPVAAPTKSAPRPSRKGKGKGKKEPSPEPEDESDSGDDVPPAKAAPPPPRKGTKRKTPPTEKADDSNDGDNNAAVTRGGKKPKTSTATAAGPAPPADAPAPPTEEELRADDADNNADSELPDADALASVEAAGIAHRDNILRFRLQVYPCPAGTSSRLFYRLRVYLVDDAHHDGREAGYIHAYRIAKRTARRAHADNEAWVRELLAGRPDRVAADLHETALCLRALFTQAGNVGPARRGYPRKVAESLADRRLMFIEMVHVRRRFQKRGLLTPAFEQWQRLLQRLPEVYAFTGNAVLVPGPPNNEQANRTWEGKIDVQVEEILTRLYERQNFVVWVRGQKVGDDIIRVMGKRLRTIAEE